MQTRTQQPFHFQPHEDEQWSTTDNAPLLFTSNPPGRMGDVTLFYRTRKTLRQRLGVSDPGELDGVLAETSAVSEREQMRQALSRASNYRYIFPDNRDEDAGCPSFTAILERALAS